MAKSVPREHQAAGHWHRAVVRVCLSVGATLLLLGMWSGIARGLWCGIASTLSSSLLAVWAVV